MPYVYIGKKSIFEGRPLFKILCNLKNFGQGRVVYRTSDYLKQPGKVHFYRILYAQPEMDPDTCKGRVVVEQVKDNLRLKEPQIISEIAELPDFRLVPKDEEETFCNLSQVRDYDPRRDARFVPNTFAMPPIMKEVVQRNKEKRGEKVSEEDFHLPAHKIYSGDFNIEDRVADAGIRQSVTGRFDVQEDFKVGMVPDSWNLARPLVEVGVKTWAGYTGGHGWEEQKKRNDLEEKLLKEQGSK